LNLSGGVGIIPSVNLDILGIQVKCSLILNGKDGLVVKKLIALVLVAGFLMTATIGCGSASTPKKMDSGAGAGSTKP